MVARGKRVLWPLMPVPVTGSAVYAFSYERDKASALELHVFGLKTRIHDAHRDALPVISQGIGGRCFLCGQPPAALVFRRFPTGLRGGEVSRGCGDKPRISRIRPLVRCGAGGV